VEEETAHEERRTNFAAIAREHLDLAPLLKEECAIEPSIVHSATIKARSKVRFGVARDKAFSFYYADNLDLMREHGAEIVEFSPLHDEDLPPDLDGLYLGGGYPELYAEALSANKRMRVAIRSFVEQDRPVYAECGGMIYLGNSLTLIDGRQHPMAGVLPFAFEMTSRLVRFGYVEIEFTSDCLLGRKGQKARGHSFHYSRMLEIDSLPTAYLAHSSLSKQIAPEGFCYKNVLASYIHLHFRAKDTMASSLLDAAIRSRAVGVTA
jgi:cobyrinic acid a,c-diamide synthase